MSDVMYFSSIGSEGWSSLLLVGYSLHDVFTVFFPNVIASGSKGYDIRCGQTEYIIDIFAKNGDSHEISIIHN